MGRSELRAARFVTFADFLLHRLSHGICCRTCRAFVSLLQACVSNSQSLILSHGQFFHHQPNTMTKRLQRIAPLQLGIVLATFYGALALIFVPFIILFSLFGADSQSDTGFLAGGVLFVILIPLLYAAGGFVVGIIAAAVYNLIAKWTGGIEFTLADTPQR
jgi:hypothetical protein